VFSPEVAERTIHAGCPDQAFLLRCPNPRPNVVDVVDREVDDALARSSLAELPTELAGRLLAEGERADYPAGTTVPASPPSCRMWTSQTNGQRYGNCLTATSKHAHAVTLVTGAGFGPAATETLVLRLVEQMGLH
jgi:hypothetical protein